MNECLNDNLHKHHSWRGEGGDGKHKQIAMPSIFHRRGCGGGGGEGVEGDVREENCGEWWEGGAHSQQGGHKGAGF